MRKYTTAEGPWERPWLKEPIEVGVFLTPRPDLVAKYHGIRKKRIYAYDVPRWVIKAAGGIHIYDSAPEIIIDKELWDSARSEIRLLGSKDFKSLSSDKLQRRTPFTSGGGEFSFIRSEHDAVPQIEKERKKANMWLKLIRAARPKKAISFMTEREKEEMLDSIATWRRITQLFDFRLYYKRSKEIEASLKGE